MRNSAFEEKSIIKTKSIMEIDYIKIHYIVYLKAGMSEAVWRLYCEEVLIVLDGKREKSEW